MYRSARIFVERALKENVSLPGQCPPGVLEDLRATARGLRKSRFSSRISLLRQFSITYHASVPLFERFFINEIIQPLLEFLGPLDHINSTVA